MTGRFCAGLSRVNRGARSGTGTWGKMLPARPPRPIIDPTSKPGPRISTGSRRWFWPWRRWGLFARRPGRGRPGRFFLGGGAAREYMRRSRSRGDSSSSDSDASDSSSDSDELGDRARRRFGLVFSIAFFPPPIIVLVRCHVMADPPIIMMSWISGGMDMRLACLAWSFSNTLSYLPISSIMLSDHPSSSRSMYENLRLANSRPEQIVIKIWRWKAIDALTSCSALARATSDRSSRMSALYPKGRVWMPLRADRWSLNIKSARSSSRVSNGGSGSISTGRYCCGPRSSSSWKSSCSLKSCSNSPGDCSISSESSILFLFAKSFSSSGCGGGSGVCCGGGLGWGRRWGWGCGICRGCCGHCGGGGTADAGGARRGISNATSKSRSSPASKSTTSRGSLPSGLTSVTFWAI